MMSQVDRLKVLHPDFEYVLMTDEDIQNYILEQYPAFYPQFMGYKMEIQRVDIIRYFLLYDLGGYYMDLDVELYCRLDELAPDSKGFCVNEDPGNKVGNYLMGAEKGHPFFREAMAKLEPGEDIHRHVDVLESTGPMYLSKLYNEDPKGLDLIEDNINGDKRFVHLYRGTWDAARVMRDKPVHKPVTRAQILRNRKWE